MIYCYDCGVCLHTKTEEGKLKIYDSEREIWTEECPSCEGRDFYDEGEEYETLALVAD